MFQAKEIVYGYFKGISNPKHKYLIVLFRDENLLVTASFTTSQPRSGVQLETVEHGPNKNDKGDVLSYVFLANHLIGINPETAEPFSFPRQTTVPFDYGVIQFDYAKLNDATYLENPKVVCVLSDQEYYNLVYAMYRSTCTKGTVKTVLERILQQMQ